MAKTDEKTESKIVGVRFMQEDLEVMEAWSEKHQLPLSWVVRRCVELGLPQFLLNPISRPEDNTAA